MSTAIATRAFFFFLLVSTIIIIFAIFRFPSPAHFSPPSVVLAKALSILQSFDGEVNAFNDDHMRTAFVPARPTLTRRSMRRSSLRPAVLVTNNNDVNDFVPGNRDVKVLTNSNFSDFVSKNRYVLVNFYSPCCYWSRRLAPIFEAAGRILEGEAVLVKVDGTVETELKDKFNIGFYPTMVLLVDGVHLTSCYGYRTGDAIAAWVREKIKPVPTITTNEEAKRVLATRSVMVIGFLGNPKGLGSEELVAASKQHKDINFYQTTDIHVASLFRIGGDHTALVMLRRMNGNSSPSYYNYDGPFNRLAISDFITALKCLLAVDPFGDDEMVEEKQVSNGLSDQVVNTFHAHEVELLWPNKPEDAVFSYEKSLSLRKTKMNIFRDSLNSLSPGKRIFNSDNNHEERSRQEKPMVDERDVVVLTEKNFSDFVARNQYVMLNFYAPWCFWSKRLAPEYAAAATLLKDEAVFAKIDATAEVALAREYSIKGYPTVILLISGVEKVYYYNDRTREAISTWVKQKMDVVVQTVETTEEAELILSAGSIVIMAFIDNLQGPDSMELSAASKLHTDIKFYQTAVPEVARLFEIDPKSQRPALVMLKRDTSNHRHMIGFDGHFTRSAIADFVTTYKVPSFMNFRAEDGTYVFTNPRNKIWLFAPKHSWEVRNTFEEASNGFEEKLLFLFVDSDYFGQQLAHSLGLALDLDSPTAVVAHYANGDLVQSHKYNGELTVSGIKSFAKEFLEDKLSSQ